MPGKSAKSVKRQNTQTELKPRAIDYVDFVIEARRISSKLIETMVKSSPAGSMSEPITIPFSETEVREIKNSFYIAFSRGLAGRAKINQAEAVTLGKQLSTVLFPTMIFEYFSKSFARVVQNQKDGLRIRLAFEETLIDLPWEYIYRPDRSDNGGISGFILLDSYVSIVRQPADDRIGAGQVKGRQKLAFVGSLWEGNSDLWEVNKEFNLLTKALKPVSDYIHPEFNVASVALSDGRDFTDASIFHYAGHCDFDSWGTGYLIHEMPSSGLVMEAKKTYVNELAELLGKSSQSRLVVLSACNSGFWPVVKPLLGLGISAIIGVNGSISNQSIIEFCSKLYESLAIGLTLDESVNHARLHLFKLSKTSNLFDWGLFMVYMPSTHSVIFPRKASVATRAVQKQVRKQHELTIGNVLKIAEELDKLDFGQIMSECTRRRVLILGRFTDNRLKVLEEIKKHLKNHKNNYIPELFTFPKPEDKGLTEAIIGFAAFSKFIIADLSEPKSVPAELQAIVPNFFSLPVVPIIRNNETEYATFADIQQRHNVVKPTIRYSDLDDLQKKLEKVVIPKAEAKVKRME